VLSYRSETRRRIPRPAAISAAPIAATGSTGKPVRGSCCALGVLDGAAVVAVGEGVAAGVVVGAGVGAGVVVVPLDFFFGWLGTFENGSWYWLSPALSARLAAGKASTAATATAAGRRLRSTGDW